MPITPSLRHCSNKYKLAREGEKDKEKDEDFEKVKEFCKRCLVCVDFSPDSKNSILWINTGRQLEVKNPLMMDLFLILTQLLASQDVNVWSELWSGVF